MNTKRNKERKTRSIIFSEEIDSTIGGTAVGMAFISISLFLTFYRGYIISEVVTTIFVWLMLLFGMPILLACLFSKTQYDGRSSMQEYKINSNHLGWCAFFIILLIIYHIYVDIKWLNILPAFFMFLLAFLAWQELLFFVCAKKGDRNQRRKEISSSNIETEDKKTSVVNVLSVIGSIASIIGLGIALFQIISGL